MNNDIDFETWLKGTIISDDKGNFQYCKGSEGISEDDLLQMKQVYEEQMILASVTDEQWAEYMKERLAEPFMTFDDLE